MSIGFQQITHLIDSNGFHSPAFLIFNWSNDDVEGSEEDKNLGIEILLSSVPLSTGAERRRRFLELLGFTFGHLIF